MITEVGEKPKSRHHSMPEGKIQADCVSWFWNNFPQYRKCYFAIPNENSRIDSNAISGAIRKAMGVTKGVADTFLAVQKGGYGGLFIEYKTDVGRQSSEQKEWEIIIQNQGYLYRVIRSLEEFKELINWYLSL